MPLRSHSGMIRQDLNLGLSGPGSMPIVSPKMGNLEPRKPTAPLFPESQLLPGPAGPLASTSHLLWFTVPSLCPGFYQGLLSSRTGGGRAANPWRQAS